MLKAIAMAAAVALLTGCAAGIRPGVDFPSQTFEVSLPYQEAHRRADAAARQCFPGMLVTGVVYTDKPAGNVRQFGADATTMVEDIEIEGMGADTSKVTITVWGVGVWDEHQMDAMRQSIETGSPVCRQYQKQS